MELSPATRRLRAAFGFLRLPPTEPELQLLHRWLDTRPGVGLITVGARAPRDAACRSVWGDYEDGKGLIIHADVGR